MSICLTSIPSVGRTDDDADDDSSKSARSIEFNNDVFPAEWFPTSAILTKSGRTIVVVDKVVMEYKTNQNEINFTSYIPPRMIAIDFESKQKKICCFMETYGPLFLAYVLMSVGEQTNSTQQMQVTAKKKCHCPNDLQQSRWHHTLS